MIILATDYAGYKIVEYLINIKEPISFLVLDTKDRGVYNDTIEKAYRLGYKNEKIYNQYDLADGKFLEQLKRTNLNLGLLAWWPYILKSEILLVPKMGWLNLHTSYLPYNRGKHSSFWSIVEQTPCGVSLQFIDEGIDTGDIVARKEIDINWEDTSEMIHNKCREEVIELFKDNFQDIKNNRLPKIKQNLNEGTYHHSSEIKNIIKIDLDANYTARKLLNIIRAKISPPAYFLDKKKKYSVKIIIKEMKNDE